ncbi:MAG: hypothetical protein COC00_005250 [Rhizobiales bacterium]|nr:hypothetical protein [Hyphomicrobiales bacterium]
MNAEHTSHTARLSNILMSEDKVGPQDVLRMRKDIFRDGIVTINEADALFAINNTLEQTCDEWHEFFIEALTQFTVFQLAPSGYITDENSAWLMEAISRNGIVETATELELLVKILATAKRLPATLVQFTMLQVSVAVLNGEGPLARGGELTQGIIGQAEVELLRTIMYAASSENALAISKQEVEVLQQLNDATNGANNHAAWQGLYVGATANYLMSVSGEKAPSRDSALAKQAWLEDTEVNHTGFMKEMVSGFGKLLSADFFDDIFTSSHVMMEKIWKEKNDGLVTSMHQSEGINAQEAAWLLARIHRDGDINENEKALLRFLDNESQAIDPSLQTMINQVA